MFHFAVVFILGLFSTRLLFLFGLMFYRDLSLSAEVFEALLVGLRFDLSVLAYILILPSLNMALKPHSLRVWRPLICFMSSLAMVLSTYGFWFAFRLGMTVRESSQLMQAGDWRFVLSSSSWLLWFVLLIVFVMSHVVFFILLKRAEHHPIIARDSSRKTRLVWAMVGFLALSLLARGSFEVVPLGHDPAIVSQNAKINQLSSQFAHDFNKVIGFQ